MSQHGHGDWFALAPPFSQKSHALKLFREHARRVSEWLAVDTPDPQEERTLLEDSLAVAREHEQGAALAAAMQVVSDLARQRWSVRVSDEQVVEVKLPGDTHLDHQGEKARVRAQELVKRDEQLRQPATRKFVKSMEHQRHYAGRFVSVFSLMRDGRELAEALRTTRDIPIADRAAALAEVINPYLQFVDDTKTCSHTGLRLQDIWRYFRHTWTNQYTSTPGRSMAFLVRDRAHEFHPVVGIGALGSPIVQIRERDFWIGWHPDAFIEHVNDSPSTEIAVWLQKTVNLAIGELFVDDFIAEGLIGRAELRAPADEAITRLTEYGEEQRKLHHRFARSQDLKRSVSREEGEDLDLHWQERAKTHLFRSKRALSLAEMLRARLVLNEHLSAAPSLDEVRALASTRQGRKAIKKILRKAKADRVGIAMADITVCGAVAPYNPILGGKLVSMLAASPEVVAAYQRKYRSQESEIASSMAGRPIIRPSSLVFLGTTSLYGVGSSQYNRVRVPASRLGGREDERLEYLELGRSDAYGTSHFSTATVDALVSLVQQSNNGQRVNSIFGEGVSPKLRKIRDGLDELNLPTDALLRHGRHRIVYGIPLTRNLREYLLGMNSEPEYLFELGGEDATRSIAQWWTERWLTKRIDRDEVLEQVAINTMVRPIRHGARVVSAPSQ